MTEINPAFALSVILFVPRPEIQTFLRDQMPRLVATATNRNYGEAGVMVLICFGWFILVSLNAVASNYPARSLSDSMFLSLVLSEIVFASLALIYLKFRGYDLNWLRPNPTSVGCIIGVGLYVAVALLAGAVSLLAGEKTVSAQPILEMLYGATYSLPMLAGLSIVNGLYEETFLTGYLLQGLSHLGAALSIGVVCLVRLVYHLYQGPLGAIGALVYGLIVGLYYWRTKDLWSVIVAHMSGDFAGLSMS